MSELPSPEMVTGEFYEDLPTYLQNVLLPLALAWRSGRLVDREAIDYERIEEILLELCEDWYDMVIREGKMFDFGAAIRALAAALGGTDNERS